MSTSAHKPPVVPYQQSKLSKKAQVMQMFNEIAGKYDLLNRLLSAGIDIRWRKKAIRLLADVQPKSILDVATGTADVALMLARFYPQAHIIGVDIAAQMLQLGQQKIEQAQLQDRITLQQADAEALPFPDHHFDAVMVAFGVRNFENLHTGLSEMLRVLKPGGKAVILEFSYPESFPVKQLYHLYFRYITPMIGKWLAHHREAYCYLPESVSAFPYGQRMIDQLTEIGYQQVTCRKYTWGICSVYCGYKKQS
ncbi:MAG: bifunctional demethylmenaquinone methyltransferase/2-methoxy-6-polyprenyl-1,4-benzoquinol methylase UbiE [Thermoflavifilum sp.]|uniref:bifunctional demethylmenaquinone methyltransferase/2-methoxy-6-polyprenyl-1,4-benzoquinol methylase UbiE n=1 Tax=Thermoflavifilum sp. TaxID=1968839 RepID=UPI0018A54518|nr:bifunctional demethylmenaquinone methyltransferase/2-methoxy-6-polyprenyl-1,4-benzoquinol methylase UbiE [Thermoflavifilum sp.]QOR74986.1 MAG: bifunctional demethylmenaquinone methyltransferase/2-methoxy-6-polyprenyl-1,4-benzoquinol methylase UbiE [Thermoflavifilum sp.]